MKVRRTASDWVLSASIITSATISFAIPLVIHELLMFDFAKVIIVHKQVLKVLLQKSCSKTKRRAIRLAFVYLDSTKINLRSYRCLGTSRLGYGRRIRYLRGLLLASTSKIWLLLKGSSQVHESKGDPILLSLGQLECVAR